MTEVEDSLCLRTVGTSTMWLVTSRMTTSRRRSGDGTVVSGMGASEWMRGAALRRPLLVGSLGRGARPGLLRRGQADVVVRRRTSRRSPAGAGLKSMIERVLHGKDRVVLEVLVVAVEDLRRSAPGSRARGRGSGSAPGDRGADPSFAAGRRPGRRTESGTASDAGTEGVAALRRRSGTGRAGCSPAGSGPAARKARSAPSPRR